MNKIQKVIPSFDAVVKIVEVPDAGVEKIHLKPEEWKVLSFVDGTRAIKQIASKANISEFETARILYGLVSSGLVKIKQKAETPRAPQPPPEIDNKDDKKDSGGFLGIFKRK
jgi:hypothetical protein